VCQEFQAIDPEFLGEELVVGHLAALVVSIRCRRALMCASVSLTALSWRASLMLSLAMVLSSCTVLSCALVAIGCCHTFLFVVVSYSMCCAVIIALRCMVAQVLDCNNLFLVWLAACAS